MRFWKGWPALAAAAVLALAVALFVRRGVIDVLLMILMVAALVGMYLLRRYARAELLYRRAELRRRRPGGSRPGEAPGDVASTTVHRPGTSTRPGDVHR
jgi:hypothetical protein